MSKMKVTVHVGSPDDFILAMRAVKSAIESNRYDVILKYQDGSTFYVYATNRNNWVVRKVEGENERQALS